MLISELRAIGDAVRKLGQAADISQRQQVGDSDGDTVDEWRHVLPPGYTTERANGKPAGLVTARQLIHAEHDRVTPDLTLAEYHRRAEGLAEALSKEFRRLQEIG